MDPIEHLKNEQYINLETFRKSGIGVRTPVWFVQSNGSMYVQTIANSGKVKRIRNKSDVNIAACKVDGALLGEWRPATARELDDPNKNQDVDHMLDKKYGMLKKIYTASASLKGQKYTLLEINLKE
jgi:uncharacterized protein